MDGERRRDGPGEDGHLGGKPEPGPGEGAGDVRWDESLDRRPLHGEQAAVEERRLHAGLGGSDEGLNREGAIPGRALHSRAEGFPRHGRAGRCDVRANQHTVYVDTVHDVQSQMA